MQTLKTLFLAAAFTVAAVASSVAAAAPVTADVAGVDSKSTSALMQFIERGQALRAADPVAYDTITGENNYISQNPQFNVHGS